MGSRGYGKTTGRRGPYSARPWHGEKPKNALRSARLAKHQTQEQAAAEIGIARSALAMYESGKRPIPSTGWERRGRPDPVAVAIKKYITNSPA